MANTKTLQDSLDIFYAILKEFEDSNAYPLVFTTELLNRAEQDICAGAVTDLTTSDKDQLQKVALPFLQSNAYFNSVMDTYADGNAVIGADTLTVSATSDFASAGFLWVNGDIVEYTGVTATSFTGIAATGNLSIEYPHTGGTRVSQLFKLPDDYASVDTITYNSQVTLEPKDYRNLYRQLNNSKSGYGINNNNATNTSIDRFNRDLPPFYVIIEGQYILPFQLDESGSMIHVVYEKDPTELVETTDTMTIPDKYSTSTIPYIAVGEMLYNRGEEARGLEVLRMGYGKILSMYKYFGNQNNEMIFNQRVETGKDDYLNL